MTKYPLIATAAAGIEALVGKELRDMGYEVQVENGRARFEGSLDDVAHTNINLRTADRIKIVMGDFKAITFDQLFESTKAIPWEDILPMDAEFPVSGKSVNSKLHLFEFNLIPDTSCFCIGFCDFNHPVINI